MFDKNLEIPQKEPADYVHTVLKAAIASIPRWWAAPGAELFAMVFASPYEKRRDELLEDIAWVVRETAARVDDLQPEKLAQNEALISAVSYAARIAMSTHQREKREYLRNALLNIAVGNAYSEIKQQIFLNAIEAFAPAHVKALNLIWRSAAPSWETLGIPPAQRTYGTAIGVVSPELRGQPALIDAVLAELRNRGLTTLSNAQTQFPSGGLVTNLTSEFLTFVLNPEDLP
jgi:hypothetical protein